MEKNHIGKRKKNGGHKTAGRKPLEDKKIPVQVYINKSRIDELGGIEKARLMAKNALEND